MKSLTDFYDDLSSSKEKNVEKEKRFREMLKFESKAEEESQMCKKSHHYLNNIETVAYLLYCLQLCNNILLLSQTQLDLLGKERLYVSTHIRYFRGMPNST